ncbi:MAG: fructose-bisphosphate aldolase [Patescibacteria group bacterium]|nr:fructose-bisphosphate aldolase [Patescibacteria group bacterium]
MISLDKITTNNKALYLAYDQGFEHGPTDFNDENVDPNFVLDIGIKGGFNAIIFQKGVAEKYYPSTSSGQVPSASSLQQSSEQAGQVTKIPLILKLNGKTNLVEGRDPYSPLLCTVSEALDLGAVAVGYTIYVGSEFESKMTSEFSSVVREAHEKGVPVIGWMYLAGKFLRQAQDKQKGRELTAYAARLGLELGADIIKIKYPGDLESLKWAVESAGKTKVVISGGVKENENEFLETAKTIMETEAIGMAVGRNIWQNKNPLEITKKLKEIIFKNS